MAEILEIERRFVVTAAPAGLDQYPSVEIEQGYLKDTVSGEEARVRRKGTDYYLTIKRGEGLLRIEIEKEIPKEEFERLWPQTSGRRIQKTRYRIPFGVHTIEFDVYHGPLAGFFSAEVEFGSQSDSQKFEPPAWFGEELTGDPRYNNAQLAIHGLPQDLPQLAKAR